MRRAAQVLVLLAVGGGSMLARAGETLRVPPPDGGSTTLIGRALALVESRYIAPERVDTSAMLRGALHRAAKRVDGLSVRDRSDPQLVSRDGRRVRIAAGEVRTLTHLAATLDAVAAWITKTSKDTTRGDVEVALASGAVGTLDRWSKVVSGDEQRMLRERFRGDMAGIGCRVGRRLELVRVLEVWPGTPAAAAGVRADDVVVSVDGRSTESLSVQDVVRGMRGPEGTRVAISLRRGESSFDVQVVRARIRIPTVTSRQLAPGIGYLRVLGLAQNTAGFAIPAIAGIREAPGLKGLIVDLRGNTGGSILAAAAIADAFIDEGMLVETRGRGGIPVPELTGRVDATATPPGLGEAIVVLVDRRTGSSAELLAATLARRDRALILGARTYGKTVVQKLYDIGPDTTLKLTVAEMLAAGEPVPSTGLAPDVLVERGEHGARVSLADCEGSIDITNADDDADPVLAAAVELLQRWMGPARAGMLAAARRDVCDTHATGS